MELCIIIKLTCHDLISFRNCNNLTANNYKIYIMDDVTKTINLDNYDDFY